MFSYCEERLNKDLENPVYKIDIFCVIDGSKRICKDFHIRYYLNFFFVFSSVRSHNLFENICYLLLCVLTDFSI